MVMILSGLQVCSEKGILQQGEVVIENGKITAIYDNQKSSPKKNNQHLIFPNDYYLVPGFIDLHVHGANGSDVMDASSDALNTIAQTLAKEGVTGFLATTMTASPEEIETVLITTRDFISKQAITTNQSGAKVLGVHLEGPFLSPKKIGAQREDKIIHPQIELIAHWQSLTQDVIKLVTLAPELSNSLEVIHFLKQNKIIASIGHTDATYAETMAAIDAGCSYATHLFNAMRGMHQREPGAVTAALLSDQVTAELILDGNHLHPAIVQVALKLKGSERLVLVTDAMRAKCLKDGAYDLGGQTVTVKNNVAQLADGTLAGSVLTMNLALKNLLAFTDCAFEDAIRMATENPARTLGLFDRKGSIALGKDADLVVMDRDFNVVLTLSEGQIIYQQ